MAGFARATRALGLARPQSMHVREARRSFAAAVPADFNVLPGDEGDAAPGMRPAIVDAYDESGFTVGGLDYAGPVICLGKQLALQWAGVQCAQDITPSSLRVLELVRPRPELLLIGTGQTPAAHALSKETRTYLSGLGIKIDVLSTRHAAATHNFLSEEGRSVATALLLYSAQP